MIYKLCPILLFTSSTFNFLISRMWFIGQEYQKRTFNFLYLFLLLDHWLLGQELNRRKYRISICVSQHSCTYRAISNVGVVRWLLVSWWNTESWIIRRCTIKYGILWGRKLVVLLAILRFKETLIWTNFLKFGPSNIMILVPKVAFDWAFFSSFDILGVKV